MRHQLISEGSSVSCLVCGAVYLTDADGEPSPDKSLSCTGRTDLVHTYDIHNSGHILECPTFADTDTCPHIDFVCDCDACG